ncbi:atrial natriuretic peptide receptor 1, partial [Biomphalaria pfeifferi]
FMTLTRVGLTFNGMVLGLDAIFRVNQWQKILVLYEKGGFPNLGESICFLGASALIHFSKSKFRLPYEFDLFEPDRHDIKKLLIDKVGLNYA